MLDALPKDGYVSLRWIGDQVVCSISPIGTSMWATRGAQTPLEAFEAALRAYGDLDPVEVEAQRTGRRKGGSAAATAGGDRPTYSTDRDLDEALKTDAEKLEALGASPGPTLDDFGLNPGADDDLIGGDDEDMIG